MSLDKITVYKIKDAATDFGDFIASEDGKGNPLPELQDIELPNLGDFSGTAVAKAAFKQSIGKNKTQDDIPWLAFLNEGLPEASKFEFQWQNNFPSAVVAIKIMKDGQAAFYGLTFGLGGNAFLKGDSIVRDFGIRVAMNICDRDRLKRVQTSIHEAISTQSEKQISAGGSFSVFNIDDEKEFLQSVSGLAKEGYDYIQTFSGKESISLKIEKDKPLSWTNMIRRLHDLTQAYNKDDYKSVFPGYDRFHFETDRLKINELDRILFEKIRSGDYQKIHLAPPEFIDYESHSFLYVNNKEGEKFSDLTLSDLLKQRKRKFTDKSSIKSIKDMKVYLHDATSDIIIKDWSAYRCLVAEIDFEDNAYILSMGQWKQVSHELKDEVSGYMSTIPTEIPDYILQDIEIWDPQAGVDASGGPKGENREAKYNSALAAASPNIFLFDKARVKIAGKKQYEVCDLLHSDKVFVQVKRYRSGAASVSHLFLQGRFYADAFLRDSECRESMREHIKSNPSGKNIDLFVSIIPEERKDIIPNQFGIVFCILTDNSDLELSNLPFMSQYELMLTHKQLTIALGFMCSVVLPRVVLGGE